MPPESESLPPLLGLIAGEGRFPFLVLEEAGRRGIRVVGLLIEGAADPALAANGAECHWVALGQLSRSARILRDAGCDRAILAGRVSHVRALDVLRPDRLALKVLARSPSRAPDAILKTVAGVLGEEGVTLLDSTVLLREHMASAGAMTRKRPRREDLENLRFGLAMARGIAALDVGQTVVVRRKAVVAAEAMEGTDAAIRRAAEVTRGPFVVVKVARPAQDMRFDVPVIGPTTLDSMRSAGAVVLGLEAGRVLLLDRKELLERADREGIAVYGLSTE